VAAINHLTLVREAPERAAAEKSARVRRGYLIGGPGTAIVPIGEGVTDLVRRWTLSSQELPGLEPPAAGHRVGLFERFAREVADVVATPSELLYIDGAIFVKAPDGRFIGQEHPRADAPRHPNDPAWCLDILYGVQPPIKVLQQTQHEDGLHVSLAAVADLSVADRTSPYGVRLEIASRNSRRDRVPFELSLNGDRVVRVSLEHVSGYSASERFWSATEFWDFGVDVQELWESTVSRRMVATDR
jgi:hypothetical protein